MSEGSDLAGLRPAVAADASPHLETKGSCSSIANGRAEALWQPKRL